MFCSRALKFFRFSVRGSMFCSRALKLYGLRNGQHRNLLCSKLLQLLVDLGKGNRWGVDFQYFDEFKVILL